MFRLIGSRLRGSLQGSFNWLHEEPGFVNRVEEFQKLKDAARPGCGNLMVLTGAENVGKTDLLRQLSRKLLSDGDGTPIYMSRYVNGYETAAQFTSELKSALLKRPTTPEEHGVTRKCLEITDMFSLLEVLKEEWKSASRYPTLIIDDALVLRHWSKTPSEQEEYKILKAWLLAITRERIANVILCSSTDLFWRGIFGAKDETSIKFHQIGDLSEQEALQLFLDTLGKKKLPPDLWKDIHDYTGGRIAEVEDAATYMKEQCQGRRSWASCKSMRESQSQIGGLKGFYPFRLKSPVWDYKRDGTLSETRLRPWKRLFKTLSEEENNPLWTTKEYVAVVKKIIASEKGVVALEELKTVVPEVAVNSLLKFKLLHLRMDESCKDLEWYKGRWPAIMLPSRPHFHAVKKHFDEGWTQSELLTRYF